MKIYDMIEGKWLKKDKKKNKKKEDSDDHKDRYVITRLVTYDEEKEWIENERTNSSR
jgi:hypothetical protein